MNVKELIGKYEYMSHACFRRVDTLEVLKDLRQLDEPQKVVVPQFIADWIKYCKNTFLSLARALMIEEVDFYNYANQEDHSRLIDFFGSGINQETFARAWLDGYEVEKEKRYLVRIIGITNYNSYLNYHKEEDKWTIESRVEIDAIRTEHTRKELEEAGFGWIFSCEGIEVEEVD